MPGTIPYAPDLEAALRRSTDFARASSHANAGAEHVLLALLDEPRAAETLRACKIKLDTLRQRLIACLDNQPVAEAGTELQATDTLQQVLSRAALHVEVSGAKEMTGAHVVVAVMAERCRAASFLQEQGAKREDAVAHVTRTTPPPPPPSAPQRVTVAEKGYVDLPSPEPSRSCGSIAGLANDACGITTSPPTRRSRASRVIPRCCGFIENTPNWREKARRKVRRMPYVRY